MQTVESKYVCVRTCVFLSRFDAMPFKDSELCGKLSAHKRPPVELKRSQKKKKKTLRGEIS